MSRIKAGDQVRVISGKHKGAEGAVLEVLRDKDRIVIENVNVIKKAQRPTQENPRGGYAEREAPIHVSNVMVLDPQSGEPTRIRMQVQDDGRKVRVAAASGAKLDE